MKFKHVLFTGALTTVAAVMLLTLVLPPALVADPPPLDPDDYKFLCYPCPYSNLFPPYFRVAHRKARQQALAECLASQGTEYPVYCTQVRGQEEVVICSACEL